MPTPRTSISLTADQRARLDALAARTGTSVAHHIRAAVTSYLGQVSASPSPLPVASTADALLAVLRTPEHWRAFLAVCQEMAAAYPAADPLTKDDVATNMARLRAAGSVGGDLADYATFGGVEPPAKPYRYSPPAGVPRRRAEPSTEPLPF